jgi:hypothetical protein
LTSKRRAEESPALPRNLPPPNKEISMKKNIKILLFSFIGLVALGGITLAFFLTRPENAQERNPDNTSTVSKESVVFTDFTAGDVVSIHITNPSDIGYTIKAGENGFIIPELDNEGTAIPYNQQLLSSAAEAAASLSSKSTVEKNAEDLQKYGLSAEASDEKSAAAKAEVTFLDGTGIVFFVGEDSPELNSVYFRIDGSNDVYSVASTDVNPFINNRFFWLNKQVFPEYDSASAPEISEVKVTRKDWDKPIIINSIPPAPLEETHTFNSHKLTSPLNIEIDPEKSKYLLYGIFNLTASDIMAVAPDEEFLKTAGLTQGEPLCSVEVTSDGRTYKLEIGNPIKNENGVTLGWLGASGEFPGIVFLFDYGTLPWLFTEPKDIIAEMFLSPYIYTVKELSVESGDKTLHFTITGDAEDNSVFFNSAQQPLSEDERERFGDFYRFIISARGEELIPENSGENIEQYSEPTARISYVYRDSSRPNDILEYYTSKQDERTVVIYVNGEAVYKSRDLYTARLIRNIEAYITGGEIVLDW